MAVVMLVHVLEEISRDGHCEALNLLRSHQATVIPRNTHTQVFEVCLDTGDETILQADMATLQARGKIEIITPADYVRRFSGRSAPPRTKPPSRYDPGGPYIL